MNGLVQEWCADHWVKSYVSGRQQHPLVVTDARTYVVRGGASLPKRFNVVAHVRLLTKISAAMVSVCDWFGSRLTISLRQRTKRLRPPLASNHTHGLLLGHPVFDVRVSVRAR